MMGHLQVNEAVQQFAVAEGVNSMWSCKAGFKPNIVRAVGVGEENLLASTQ
jgi:hypothetical protein